MFEVAWSELLLVVIVAIIVVGPKELPGLMRTAGRMLAKLRRSADEFRKQFDEAVKEAGGEDFQREIHSLRQHNPLNQIRNSIEAAARDPYRPPATPAPASEAWDDFGPPPPLPPRTDGGLGADPEGGKQAENAGVSAPPAAPAPPQPTPANEAAPSAPAKDLADGGPGPETRINGEHRPASR